MSSPSQYALVIGINSYPGFGTEVQLAGAVRDANAMAEVLIERYGFSPQRVIRILDRDATRRAILGALDSLRQRVEDGDQVVLVYSGHGSQMTDREGDEGDGLDETLVPCDSGREQSENRDITDDEISQWAASILKVTPNLTLIFDCCHSATLHRPDWRIRAVPADRRSVDDLPPSPIKIRRDIDTGPRPLTLSACRDEENAYELPAVLIGEARGGFSFHLTESLRSASAQTTWREIHQLVEVGLKQHDARQHPQASGDGLDLPVFGARSAVPRVHGLRDTLLSLTGRPDPFDLTMKIFRSRGGAWINISDDDPPLLLEGDRMRIDLCHRHQHEIYVCLLDLGVTDTVSLLFPNLDDNEALDPYLSLTIGDRDSDRLPLHLPDGFEPDVGVCHLLLIASGSTLKTSRLLAGDIDAGDGVISAVGILHTYRLCRTK